MIGRTRLRVGLFVGIAALATSLGLGGIVRAPSALAAPAPYRVTLELGGTPVTLTTQAPTVGALLAQRGITVRPGDYLYPAPEVPLADGLEIDYRASAPVTIVVANSSRTVWSSAQTVADLLDDQQISLGADDVVTPALDAPVPANGVVRIERVVSWERHIAHVIPHATLYRLDVAHPMGRAHVVSAGRNGVRVTVISYTQRDGGRISKRVRSYVAVAPRERIIDDGLGPFGAYGDFDRFALVRFGLIARSKVRMVATAYTPHCYGCSGRTALGLRAGPGIVAVDPRVIPLGSRLYIPGYGFALAGDTGGDIVGDRVDLGFASYADAVRFGRREVTVYTLK